VSVYVVPRASRTAADGEHDGLLRVRLAAPPVEGAANAALLAYLARCCGVARRDVTLVAGDTARRKRVRIADVTPDAIWRRLQGMSLP